MQKELKFGLSGSWPLAAELFHHGFEHTLLAEQQASKADGSSVHGFALRGAV